MIIDEIKNIKSDKKELRKFGLTMAAAFGLLGGLFLWRGKIYSGHCLALALSFLTVGLIASWLLKPIQRIWMTLAVLIGWVMTRVLMVVVYCFVVCPLGILSRICGKDFLRLKLEKDSATYWIVREQGICPRENYENQF